MSRLEELIAELCPNGVEYKKLNEVFHIKNGYTPSKAVASNWENGTISWFRMEDIRTNGRVLSSSIQKVSESAIKSSGLFPKNSIIISTTATIGEHALITVDFIANQQLTCLYRKNEFIDKINMKYIYHYFFIIDELCKKLVHKSGGMPIVDMEKFKKIKIPVPPLLVQEEIVRILEPFRKLSEELNLELTKREYQYKYYRDIFLVYNLKNVKKILLGDIGRVSMCKRILKSETSLEGDVPFYKIGTFGKYPDAYISRKKYEEYKNKYPYPKKGDVLISAAGTIGRAVIYNGEDAYYQDSNIVWIDNNESNVLNKFLYYFYQLKPWYVSTGGTIARLYNDNINRTPIPVPPLEEQERIVAILDRFDALCNGLPAEIEARKKQYEYYRDKLLTFKEAV